MGLTDALYYLHGLFNVANINEEQNTCNLNNKDNQLDATITVY